MRRTLKIENHKTASLYCTISSVVRNHNLFISGERSTGCMTDLTTKFRKNFPDYAEVDEITARCCTSERFDGVEYKFFGNYVATRPIIDVVTKADGVAIENMAYSNDGNPCLTVFVAEIPQPEYDAFI